MAVKKTKKAAKPTTKATPISRKSTTTAKKSPVKQAPKPSSVSSLRSETPEAPKTTATTDRTLPTIRFKKIHAIIALAILLLLAGIYAARGFFIAATVNGEPISRLELITELERQSGQQTLDSLVDKSLILQEAKKQNVQVTDQQIEDEIKKIEANLTQQGQTLDQVLELQGLTRESLRDQVRVQKTVEILLGREIVVTESDVAEYIASNSASMPEGMEEAEMKTLVEQQLRSQKLSERFQTWLQELRQNSKINYFVSY